VLSTAVLCRSERSLTAVGTHESGRAALPITGRQIGVDVGVARFATTSDGQIIANPGPAAASAAELAAAQRSLARKQRGSANRRRAKAKVAASPSDPQPNGARNIATRAGLGSGQADTA
jgi:transposase